MKKIYFFVLLITGLIGAQPVFAQESDKLSSCENIYFEKHIKNYDSKGFMKEADIVIDRFSAIPVYGSTIGGAAIGGAIGAPIGGAIGISAAIGMMPFTSTGGAYLTQIYRNDANQAYIDVLNIIREAKMGDGFSLRKLMDELNTELAKEDRFSSIGALSDFIVYQDSQLTFCQDGKTLTYDQLKKHLTEILSE